MNAVMHAMEAPRRSSVPACGDGAGPQCTGPYRTLASSIVEVGSASVLPENQTARWQRGDGKLIHAVPPAPRAALVGQIARLAIASTAPTMASSAALACQYPDVEQGRWILAQPPVYADEPPRWFAKNAGQQAQMPSINRMGLAQGPQSMLYRVEPHVDGVLCRIWSGGLVPDMTLGGKNVVDGNYLITQDSPDQAIRFGQSRYGKDNFLLLRIDARGMTAVPYRLHAQTCAAMGDSTPMQAGGRAAYHRGDVYLDISGMAVGRIHLEQT